MDMNVIAPRSKNLLITSSCFKTECNRLAQPAATKTVELQPAAMNTADAGQFSWLCSRFLLLGYNE
jgi:hypothetical protein